MAFSWAFVDFFDVKKATISLLNPHNHFLNGRTLKVEYASAEAVRRGGNKQQKMLKDPPGDKKTGKKLLPQKRGFHQVDQTEPAAPQTPIEDIKLLTKEELEGPAPKKHKPTQEERKAAREAKKHGGGSKGGLGGRPKAPPTASTTPSGAKVTFDE